MNSVTLKNSQKQQVASGSVDGLLGKLLFDAGKITEADIGRIVAVQRQGNMRFGDAALSLKMVTEDDIERALSQQFNYPYVPAGESALSQQLVAAHQPFGAAAEAIRALRSQLVLRWLNEKRKTLTVTAPRGGDGSSVLAANLAIVFAQLGERTLLIDANLRTPSQHELFGLKSAEGLSHILAGRGNSKPAIAAVPPFENLSVLCAGPVPPNPQELLSRVAFAYLVETVPNGFDVVIIDTPPALEYADAQIIAARTNGCLLATRRHRTRLADVERVIAQMVPAGASLLGAVVNG